VHSVLVGVLNVRRLFRIKIASCSVLASVANMAIFAGETTLDQGTTIMDLSAALKGSKSRLSGPPRVHSRFALSGDYA
jgi:hypothetical protein